MLYYPNESFYFPSYIISSIHSFYLFIPSTLFGWRGGGVGLELDFVLWLHRCGDACSGVVVEPRSLCRSVVPAVLHLQLLVGGQIHARSSSLPVAGERDDDFNPVVPRLDASPACWFVWTEADDFPSAGKKVTPAPRGNGGGGVPSARVGRCVGSAP